MKPTPSLPPVLVSQDFVDYATKSFKETVALRDALAKTIEEGKLTASELVIANNMIASYNELLAISDKKVVAYEQLSQIFQNIIKIQNDMIDKLEKRLLKPKSLIEKIFGVIEKAVILLGGVTIGRAL